MAFYLKVYHRFGEYDKQHILLRNSVRIISNIYQNKQKEIPEGATVHLNINGMNKHIEILCLGKDDRLIQISLAET